VPTPPLNILCIGQSGRLGHEALLLAASFRATNPDFTGRFFVAEPQPGALWPGTDPGMSPDQKAALARYDAEILPFDSRAFGAAYPFGNKIEALAALPPGEPFLFLDSDTLFLGSLSKLAIDPARPSASMRREGTWPQVPLYGPGYDGIWGALYRRFGLDFAASLDLSQPQDYWQRYLYFNAGWYFGAEAGAFGQRFLDYALSIRDGEIDELASQPLDPWLDQVALPLVIHSFGGGRPGPELDGLDGAVTCHYRSLPLLYARESDAVVERLEETAALNPVKKVLRDHEPARRLVYQGKGREIRAMFDRDRLPAREQAIRKRIKAAGLWLR